MKTTTLAAFVGLALILPIHAGAQMTDPIRMTPDASWTYVSDQVMGGVSTGGARLETAQGTTYLRLTGQVSTANRVGFIQARVTLDSPPPGDAQGVLIRLRGNGEGYFIHLRTDGTVLPWQYYQAPVATTPDWAEVRVPFAAFQPSGALLRDTLRPDSIRSVGIVAYGREHTADVSVAEVGFY
ncbi:MAG: CIA30 family protein [Rhodobacterales bacterium]|nr:CIA30 family protein [Rhodobacterales bacterium]MDX5411853.1 CIA30 family protein [Rhodobacterales bacterium]